MKKLTHSLILPVLSGLALSACGNLSEEVDKKLLELQSKTESLDSIVKMEVDKVMTLDSLVDFENEKVKKLDSLISRSSSKFDSISKSKIQQLEKIIK